MTPEMPPDMTPDQIAALFTRPDGGFLCARWGRPVAPVIFGLADDSMDVFRTAIAAVLRDAGHPQAETDPELGANLMLFFARDWADIAAIPDLSTLTGTPDLPARMAAQGAAQYRMLRFDEAGAIRACLSFVTMTGPLANAHPAALAEAQAVGAMLTWAAPPTPSPALRGLIRAAYDPVLPAVTRDASHALRLSARLNDAARPAAAATR